MRHFKTRYTGQRKILSAGAILCVLVLFPGALAVAEPGFWTVDDIDIPSLIKGNGGSVYQIIVLTSSSHEIIKEAEYEGSLSKERHRLEADMKKPPTEMPSGNLGRYYQLESCINSDREQCAIYKTIAMGTAFEARLHPNASSLWTSYPSVEAVIKSYWEKEGLSDSDRNKIMREKEIPLNILLVDKDKKVIFDTRVQGQSAKIIDVAYGIGVVRIQLSETVGRPLLFGGHGGIGGSGLEDIYIMGFPLVQREETKREDYYASPLKRNDLCVTIGEIILRPAHSRNSSEARHIECDADSAPGMSGAPVFNERGEVIGVFIKPVAYKVGSVLAPANQIHRHFRD